MNILSIPYNAVNNRVSHNEYTSVTSDQLNKSENTKNNDIIDTKKNKKASSIILSRIFTSVLKLLKKGDFSAITGINDTVKNKNAVANEANDSAASIDLFKVSNCSEDINSV